MEVSNDDSNKEETKLDGEDTILPSKTGMQLKHVKETGPQVKQQKLYAHLPHDTEYKGENG